VLVTGRLDDDAAAGAAAALLARDARGDEPIGLHLGGPDGALGAAAFVLTDTADALRSPLRAFRWGEVGGPAIGVVTAAEHRATAPHTRFHLSQLTARFAGIPEEIAAQNHQQSELLWKRYARLARREGASPGRMEFAEPFTTGRHFIAAQGFIDHALVQRRVHDPRCGSPHQQRRVLDPEGRGIHIGGRVVWRLAPL
jgi:ATP-dependent protease ClpP protease subunit